MGSGSGLEYHLELELLLVSESAYQLELVSASAYQLELVSGLVLVSELDSE
jgi:hypothetical protein